MSDAPQSGACPVCDKPRAAESDNDFFPFCSVRCKRVDLGRWLQEEYTIPMTPRSTERSLEASEDEDER